MLEDAFAGVVQDGQVFQVRYLLEMQAQACTLGVGEALFMCAADQKSHGFFAVAAPGCHLYVFFI